MDTDLVYGWWWMYSVALEYETLSTSLIDQAKKWKMWLQSTNLGSNSVFETHSPHHKIAGQAGLSLDLRIGRATPPSRCSAARVKSGLMTFQIVNDIRLGTRQRRVGHDQRFAPRQTSRNQRKPPERKERTAMIFSYRFIEVRDSVEMLAGFLKHSMWSLKFKRIPTHRLGVAVWFGWAFYGDQMADELNKFRHGALIRWRTEHGQPERGHCRLWIVVIILSQSTGI